MPDGVTTGTGSIDGSVRGRLVRQGTSISSDGETDIFPDTCSESWMTSTSHESHLSEFIEGKIYIENNISPIRTSEKDHPFDFFKETNFHRKDVFFRFQLAIPFHL
jgi:hypothetical protein